LRKRGEARRTKKRKRKGGVKGGEILEEEPKLGNKSEVEEKDEMPNWPDDYSI